MRKYLVLMVAAAHLALAANSPALSAFQSPIPRPTLDPAWVCQQLNNCPAAHKPAEERHDATYYTATLNPITPPVIDWLAVPYQFGPDD